MSMHKNLIFEENNKYESKIYPYSILQLLKKQKRFSLLFNQGNLLTHVTGTNALIPIINIFLEKYSPKHDYNKVYCCLGTQLFHSFILIIESLNVSPSEVKDGIHFILNKQNISNLHNMKHLLALFLIYLKLLYRHTPERFLSLVKEIEEDTNTISILDYGKLEYNSVPIAHSIQTLEDGVFDKVEIITLMSIISASSLWEI